MAEAAAEGLSGPDPSGLGMPAGTLLVAGAGSIGTRHLLNLRTLGHEDLAFFRTGDRPVLASDVPTERDLAAALARRPAAVLVCNPTALHMPVALAAARAGCHVFLEKPVSHSLEGTAALAEEVRRRGLVVLVGFQFRFHPGLRQIKRWLGARAIGEVVSLRAHWGEHLSGWHPGEDFRRGYSARRDLGGGVVLTLSHPFDYLRYLLGEVTAVSAETAQRSDLGLDVEDTAQVILRFASGALGVVSLDYVERPRSHGFTIVGSRGVIRWSDRDGAAHLDGPEGSVYCPAPPGFNRNTMFLDEMRHFLACLAGRDSPACTLEDGLRALEIALAAKRSAEEGRMIDVSSRHTDGPLSEVGN